MAKSNLFHKNRLDPLFGTIVEVPSIKKWKRITKTMPLKDLIALKMKIVEEIKELSGSLLGSKNLTLKKAEKIVERIEALQYNLNVLKQLNAIANVGNPSEGMFGINACIFQSSDLSGLNSLLAKLNSKMVLNKDKDKELGMYIINKIDYNKAIIENLRRTQAEYNRRLKVTVELLDVNSNAHEEEDKT